MHIPLPIAHRPKVNESAPPSARAARTLAHAAGAIALLAICSVGHAQQGASASASKAVRANGAESKAAAGSRKSFDVWEYRVLGNTVLAPRIVEQAVYGYLGPDKSINDVQSARAALEAAYRSAGYSSVFVDIPEQTVDRGIVRLAVTEGRLDRVRVSGARYFANRRILAELPAAESGKVPHLPDVQNELAALNSETPDLTVTPVLRAGRYPGTVDMELHVQDHYPLHGSFEVNNRYTADTTPLRSNFTLSYGNLWQRGHSASLQYQTAPKEPDEAKVTALTYVARLRRSGTALAFYGVDSNSDVATVGTLSVIGRGRIYGVRGIRSLSSRGRYSQNLTLGLDYKDFGEDINLTQDSGLSTAIRYMNWSAIYGFGWTMPKSQSTFTAGVDWGLRGFANSDLEFENKRYKARANYLYLVGSAEHTRNVFGGAQFDARLSWQYSAAPLVSNEQFTAGGATSVRGYLEAERFGDKGASLNVELRSPSLTAAKRVQNLRVLAFFDAASLAILDPLPGQEARFRLESTGAGLRFSGLNGMEAELDWARPLLDGAKVLKGDDRLHFRVKYGF